MNRIVRLLLPAALLGLAACATVPTGPAVMVLPGTGKSFDQFRFDDSACRGFAHEQVAGMTPGAAAADSGARSAVVGTAIGAAAGGLIAGRSGAAVGAGTGLLVGGAAGADASNRSAHGAQYRYDVAYQQCMYAKGHKIPMSGRFSQSTTARAPNYPPPDQPPPR